MVAVRHCNHQTTMQPSVSDMPSSRPSTHLPTAAVQEFEKIEQVNWDGGVPLTELLSRVHRVVVLFLPDDDGQGPSVRRVKRLYTPRSFRHYQTSSCIDPPERRGNQVFYGYRHFIQALLVRKLLWERVPTERIAALMGGRSTADTSRMLLGGVEMVAREGVTESVSQSASLMSSGPGAVETWRHIGVAPGLQLLLHSDLPKPRPAEVKEWMARIEAILRKSL